MPLIACDRDFCFLRHRSFLASFSFLSCLLSLAGKILVPGCIINLRRLTPMFFALARSKLWLYSGECLHLPYSRVSPSGVCLKIMFGNLPISHAFFFLQCDFPYKRCLNTGHSRVFICPVVASVPSHVFISLEKTRYVDIRHVCFHFLFSVSVRNT